MSPPRIDIETLETKQERKKAPPKTFLFSYFHIINSLFFKIRNAIKDFDFDKINQIFEETTELLEKAKKEVELEGLMQYEALQREYHVALCEYEIIKNKYISLNIATKRITGKSLSSEETLISEQEKLKNAALINLKLKMHKVLNQKKRKMLRLVTIKTYMKSCSTEIKTSEVLTKKLADFRESQKVFLERSIDIEKKVNTLKDEADRNEAKLINLVHISAKEARNLAALAENEANMALKMAYLAKKEVMTIEAAHRQIGQAKIQTASVLKRIYFIKTTLEKLKLRGERIQTVYDFAMIEIKDQIEKINTSINKINQREKYLLQSAPYQPLEGPIRIFTLPQLRKRIAETKKKEAEIKLFTHRYL